MYLKKRLIQLSAIKHIAALLHLWRASPAQIIFLTVTRVTLFASSADLLKEAINFTPVVLEMPKITKLLC